MNDSWKQWEGQVVEGKFTLLRFLGGSEHGGVFLVDQSAGGNPQTVIKIVSAASVDASDRLRQWKAAGDLDHPNVIRLFDSGRCELGGADFLYVQTEYAEENLSQILPERALTDGETRQMLDAVLKGLAYIHGKGLVPGRVRPSNILAAGDVVKISSDSLCAAGEVARRRGEKSVYDAPETASGQLWPSADVWSLGVTLAEVLTQRLPVLESAQGNQPALADEIPQPFKEIVENCLQIDPARRWTIAQIEERLRHGPTEAASSPVAGSIIDREVVAASSPSAEDKKHSAKWVYAVALIAAVVVVIVLIARPKPPATSPEGSGAGASAATSAGPVAEAGHANFEGAVAERVLPQISPGALHSIRGRIKIQVKVDVDETGDVTLARLKSSGPSRYFARQALEAARGWKFKPARANGQAVASQWIVQFMLSRSAINDSVERIKP